VVRVIDGDTILLDANERVRLIGVDTPESVDPRRPVEYFGKEADAFTRRMVEGKRVRLEYDQDTKDRYGRTLAYVYLENSTFLNTEIIRQGYGFAYTRFPFKYLDQFRRYERDAREGRKGGGQSDVQAPGFWRAGWSPGTPSTLATMTCRLWSISAGVALDLRQNNLPGNSESAAGRRCATCAASRTRCLSRWRKGGGRPCHSPKSIRPVH
jgi:hypothetical protein